MAPNDYSPNEAMIRELLGGNGSGLVREFRPQQLALALEVDRTLAGMGHLAAQAGTGVGKSYALLIPAILSGKRVLVSTATIALQAQYMKDLGRLSDYFALRGIHFSYALRKGRNNYICFNRYATYRRRFQEDSVLNTRLTEEEREYTAAFDKWVKTCDSGCKEDLAAEKLQPPKWWKDVCGDSDKCPGLECKFYTDCKIMRAKDEAMMAQIVVTNHTLLGIELKINVPGGKIFEERNTWLIDEAHKAAEIFLDWHEERFTEELVSDAVNERLSGVLSRIPEMGDAIKAYHQFMRQLEKLPRNEDWAAEGIDGGTRWCAKTDDQRNQIVKLLEEMWLKGVRPYALKVNDERFKLKVRNMYNALKSARHVVWIEERYKDVSLNARPLFTNDVVAPKLADRCVVCVSATLGMLDKFAEELGLSKETQVVNCGSPFEFHKRCVVFVPENTDIVQPPRNMGRSTDVYLAMYDQYIESIASYVINLCNITQGGTFVLFTARKEMKDTYDVLQRNIGHTGNVSTGWGKGDLIFQDGFTPVPQLLERFRANRGSVLFGLKSFWEGIDIPGDGLRHVILSKLPYPRQDMFYQARKQIVSPSELNFMSMSKDIPQIFGRLIRTKDDVGIFSVLEPQFANHPVRQSLPSNSGHQIPLVRTMGELQTWWGEICKN